MSRSVSQSATGSGLLPRLLLSAVMLLLLSGGALAGPFQPKNRDKDNTENQQAAEPDSSPDAMQPQAPAADAASAAQHPSQNAAPPIPLRPNMRMVIRPTILGLVPNRDPEGYGELFARVLASEGGKVQLYFEVKELAPRARSRGSWIASLHENSLSEGEGGAGHAPATGEHDPGETAAELGRPVRRALSLADFGHRIEDTRIRRGDLFFSGLDTALMASPPLFWGDGLWQASGSGIWLSRSLLAQLRNSGEATWQRFEMAGSPPPGATTEAARLLLINAQAKYPCVVNGARVMLPALYCRDSLGLAEYWIHDDPANPLLLKLSFLPPEGMKPIESIVELDESDSPAVGRDPRLPKLLVKRPGGEEREGDESGEGSTAPYSSAANQFGGQPRQAPPDVGRAQRVDGAAGAEAADGAAQAGATGSAASASAKPLPGAPSTSYRPPSIDELVACGGGYAIVEIDF